MSRGLNSADGVQGLGTQVASVTGAATTGHVPVYDANGTLVDAGAAPILAGAGAKTQGHMAVFDANGNAIDGGAPGGGALGPFPFYYSYRAGVVQGGIASLAFNTGAGSPVIPGSFSGNTLFGTAQFPQNQTALFIQEHFKLPPDWSGAIDLELLWVSNLTSGSVTWSVQTAGAAIGATVNPTFNAAQTVTTAVAGTANQINSSKISGLTLTGLAASSLFFWQVSRASDSLAGTASVVEVIVTIRRSMTAA